VPAGGRRWFRRSVHDREILALALPAFGALVAEPLYILADTAVVGRLGTVPLGGLAVASSILLTGYSLFIFLAYGTTATVARLAGAGEHQQSVHHAVQATWFAIGLGVVVLVGGIAAAPWLVDRIGPDPIVRPQAVLYLRISLSGMPAMLVSLAGTGYLRGLQDTRTPLYVAVAASAFNLALESVLIFWLGFGLGASALSTVVAQYGAAAVFLARIDRGVRAHDVSRRPDLRAIAALARVSRDLFIRTASLRAAFLVMTTVAARLGTAELAGSEIGLAVWMLLALALDAVAIAGQAIVGRFLGAGDASAARAASWRMVEWGALFGLVVGAVLAAVHDLLPALFTTDPAVRRAAATVLVVGAAMQPINAVVFVLDGILIGAGDMRYLAWAMAGSFIAFLPMAAVVYATGLGVGWLWAALAWFMVARLVSLGVRFRGSAWLVTGAAIASR
jgi:putative MATE family efflux protein